MIFGYDDEHIVKLATVGMPKKTPKKTKMETERSGRMSIKVGFHHRIPKFYYKRIICIDDDDAMDDDEGEAAAAKPNKKVVHATVNDDASAAKQQALEKARAMAKAVLSTQSDPAVNVCHCVVKS